MLIHDHKSCIDFVEKSYFGHVMAGEIEAVMHCFQLGARVMIRHGDLPERLFVAGAAGSDDELEDFYTHLCGNYDVWFGEFHHYIDIDQQKSACHFTVKLTPTPDGEYADAGPQELRNCNFFDYRDGLINQMLIYYTNPAAGSGGLPTGYPRG